MQRGSNPQPLSNNELNRSVWLNGWEFVTSCEFESRCSHLFFNRWVDYVTTYNLAQGETMTKYWNLAKTYQQTKIPSCTKLSFARQAMEKNPTLNKIAKQQPQQQQQKTKTKKNYVIK